jgi:hypothetical protein
LQSKRLELGYLRAVKLEGWEAMMPKGLMAENFFLAFQPPSSPASQLPGLRKPVLGLDCKFFESILSIPGQNFNALLFKSETEYFS